MSRPPRYAGGAFRSEGLGGTRLRATARADRSRQREADEGPEGAKPADRVRRRRDRAARAASAALGGLLATVRPARGSLRQRRVGSLAAACATAGAARS